MAKNLNTTTEQFNEKEPRGASFKALFGVLQSTTFDDLENESFGKGFPTYPEEIIFEADKIKTALNESSTLPSRTRTWITASATSLGINESTYDSLEPIKKLLRGHFSTSISADTTSNPYVEKIVMPLFKVQGTNDQLYFTYGKESQSLADYEAFSNNSDYDTPEILRLHIQKSGSYILKNFINPFKFGGGYISKYFDGLSLNEGTPFETPGESLDINLSTPNQTSGVIFDYKEGALFATAKPNDSTTPDEDPDIAAPHPIWIEAYRYYGPVGVSGPQHTITASNVQIDNNLNVDGAITLQGFSFVDVNSFNTSGSSTFGDNVDLDTHKFTGSVSITGSLFATASHALTASFATNAGQSGITTTIISSSLHDNVRGQYDITTLTSTDGSDVIEYKTSLGLIVSSSIGSPSFTHFIGSKSAATITKPNRSGDNIDSSPIVVVGSDGNSISDMPLSGRNGGDIFQYNTPNNNIDQPNFASYGAFGYNINTDYHYSTHSFSFPSPTKVTKLGLWYSNASDTDPRIDYNLSTNNYDESQKYIDEIQLSGSTDGTTWVGLYQIDNLNNQRTSSVVDSNITSTPIITSSLLDVSTDPRWNNTDSNLENQDFYILNFTSSYFDSSKYEYYKLAVGGGARLPEHYNERNHYIHHVDLWEDKDFGEGNRKQINVNFDNALNTDQPLLTNFEAAVSSAAHNAGFREFLDPQNFFIVDGTSTRNIDMNGNSINNASLLSGSSLNINGNSTIEGSQTVGTTLTVGGQSTFKDHIKVESGKSIYMDVNIGSGIPSSSIILKELNPIYFTGQNGINEFTSRIFGHTTEEGVNDLYYDAFRQYMVSDREIRLIALHPEGTVTISSSKTLITGSLEVQGNILQNGSAISAGGGSGFPHDQTIVGGITASITGSLIISGGLNSLPFIEFGSIPGGTEYDHESNNTLYVKQSGLYFGGTLISQTTNNWHVEDTAYDNSHLTSSKDIFVDGHITSSGIISSSDGFVGNLTGNATGLINRPSIEVTNVDSDSLSTIDDVQVGNFGSQQDHFIKVKSNGEADNYWSSGIKLNHGSENYGFIVNSQNGSETPSYDNPYGLNVLACDDNSSGETALFIDRGPDPYGNKYKIGLRTAFPWEQLHIKEGNVQIGALDEGNTPGEGEGPHALKLFTLNSPDSGSKIEFKHGTQFFGFTIDSINGTSDIYGLDFKYHNNNINGSSAMFINRADGNVGIGTTSPSKNLTIQGDVSASGILYVKDKAGIGGVEPQTTLHVANTGSKTHTLRIGGLEGDDSNNICKIQLAESTTTDNSNLLYGFEIINDGGIDQTNNLFIKRHSNNPTGITALSIKRDETRVGIGTEDPSKTLTVAGEISASSHLYASTSNANGNNYQTVLVDTSSGQFYYTGSYGGGGTVVGGADNDWGFLSSFVTSSRDVLLKSISSRRLRFNISQSTGTSTNLGNIEFTNEMTFDGGGPLNSNALAMMGAQSTQVQSDGIGGTELFFRATKNNSTNSDLIMKINSDEGVTIDNKLNISQSLFINNNSTNVSNNGFLGGIGFNSADGSLPSVSGEENKITVSSAYIAAYAGEDHDTNNKAGYLSIGVGEIGKNVNTFSKEVIRVAPDQKVHFADDIIAFSSTISDKRLKTNIKPLTGSLDTVCNLEGVRYDWKFKDSGPQLGVIAQQVEQYTPEVIKTTQLPLHASSPTDNTEYKTVQYEQFVPHLIEAIKELKNEVDSLKQQLKDAK